RWLQEVEAAWRTNWPSSATRWLDAIAIDGKTLRGARRLGAADVQLLSAYRTTSGVVLAELAVPDSTHELGAVGSLLARLALEETVFAVTSLTPEQADATALLRLWQEHWGIENRVHWVRDVVFGEDRATTRSGQAAPVLAAFRNLALSLLHLWRGPGITAAR